MKKSTRKYQTRRDRHLAKASGWKRQGKVSWSKVGHGAGTFSTGCDVKPKRVYTRPAPSPKPVEPIMSIGNAWPT